MQIFFDETGQLTSSKDGKYFLIASFTVGDPRRTEKRFRSWQQSRFPKKLRYLAEIKFSNNGIDEKLRLKTIGQIAKLDVRIRYVYLSRQNIPTEYILHGKTRAGHLYTELVSLAIKAYLPISDRNLQICCDQRNLKGITKPEFVETITTKLLPHLAPKPIIQVEMVDSTTNVNIQIADWIAGVLGKYHNHEPGGEEMFRILQNNILDSGVELFKDYWLNHQKTQSLKD